MFLRDQTYDVCLADDKTDENSPIDFNLTTFRDLKRDLEASQQPTV